MSTKRKLIILDVDTTSCEHTLMVHFAGRQDQYLILYMAMEDFEDWILAKGYLNINYESYNPATDSFTIINYSITKEDFFSHEDYLDYRRELAKEFVEEMFVV
jgi:hypothetical protein